MKRTCFGLLAGTVVAMSACVDGTAPTEVPTGSRALHPLGVTSVTVSGVIFTTDASCTGVNLNIYGSKADVYLDGGAAHPGGAGLPDGSYYVRITDPSGGTLLGTSVGSGNDTPVHVTGGEFDACLHLSAALIKASDNTPGYDDTPNAGGEYKVWMSDVSTFDSDATKTDNFKVSSIDCPAEEDCDPPPQGLLSVIKFYDANANGLNDDGQLITGWRVRIQDGIDYIRFTPVAIVVAADDYVVTESDPIQLNWLHTTSNVVNVTVANAGAPTVEFGNVCLAAGGGLTLGFWSNKNGQNLETAADFTSLTALHLRNANGTDRDFTGSLTQNKSALTSWLLGATATNMAYMLSAQLASMRLNVNHSFVSGSALIYAPGTPSANSLGFATVNAVMADAEAQLTANPVTVAFSSNRTIQEAIKTALDNANNNKNFVQSTPCAFSFAS